MKRSTLPLLMGAVMGTQAMLNGISALTPSHHNDLQKLFGAPAAHAEEAVSMKYTCPMHSQIISDTPGKCPICGMDLVPISGLHSHASAMEQTGAPIVEIAPATIQKMGVRTAHVQKEQLGREIRATGTIVENERTRFDMFSQIEGRVEDLHAVEGDTVHQGDVLFTLSSPDLVKLQQEYISALYSIDFTESKKLLQQIRSLGVDEQTIETIKRTEKPVTSIPFIVPADGVLTKFEVRNGHYLKVGDEIGRIQNLSEVWVEASVVEKDSGLIKKGTRADIELSDGNAKHAARVDYIYPSVNADTRTTKIRLVVSNVDGALKPGAYASVLFMASTNERLAIPSEAILRDSKGSHVILALGEGKFRAQEVQTGITANGKTEIISGLKDGDDVVTSSQFLIDSESSLRESLQKLSGGK